ncbi:MAG TPA: hypothetical protein VL284_03565, partial [Thermoanaerobaculia bacterium]|nr:hypothetical protein [Thermoanaerobaculia bacterium]
MRGRAATLSSAFVVAVFGAASVFAQLNPTVKVLPKPQTSVPPECEEGLAPAAPRVIIAENPTEEKKPLPPPTLDLKTRLRAVQIAAEQNDRDAFKAALADARAAVAAYPPGGERNAANEVLGVYNDVERLWDYQFSSPIGAFFDATSDIASMMRRYSDYSAVIADQTITANGQTIYPTEETRKFLIADAARRLDRLGVRTPTRITELPPVPVPRATPAPRVEREPHRPQAKPTPSPRPRVATKKPPATHEHAKKPTTKIARATPKPAMPRIMPQPVPEPEPRPQPPAPAQPSSRAEQSKPPAPSPQPEP